VGAGRIDLIDRGKGGYDVVEGDEEWLRAV
jgi:hypothetical protein